MNRPAKQYLIERPDGTLITSGLNSKETADYLNVSTQNLPRLNESATIKGFHVEAFPVEEIDNVNA